MQNHVACVAGVELQQRGAGEVLQQKVLPLQNLPQLPSPLSLFHSFSVSSAKIQYGTQTDVSPESTVRTTSY